MPMYRIRRADGGELVCRSFDEFHRAVHTGRIDEDAEVLHDRSGRWMSVRLHPHFSRARHTPLPSRPAPRKAAAPAPGAPRPRTPKPARPAPPPPLPDLEFELLEIEPEPPPCPPAPREQPVAAPSPRSVVVPPPPTESPAMVRPAGAAPPAPPVEAREPPGRAADTPRVRAARAMNSARRRGRKQPPPVNFRWVLPLLGAGLLAAWLLQSPEPLLFHGSEAARGSAPGVFHHHRPSAPGRRPAPEASVAFGERSSLASLTQRYQDAYGGAQREVSDALGLVDFPGLFSPGRLAPARLRATRRALTEAANILRDYRNRQIRIEQTYAATALGLTRAGAWPAGQDREWRHHPVLRESFETGQRMDDLLNGADSLLAFLAGQAGGYRVEAARLVFADPAAARRYRTQRASLIQEAGAGGGDRAPFSLRVLAAGLRDPLPPEGMP